MDLEGWAGGRTPKQSWKHQSLKAAQVHLPLIESPLRTGPSTSEALFLILTTRYQEVTIQASPTEKQRQRKG